ncbi:hypothetical protein CU097_004678 [Rhizopus azygosporus]|uniref:Uncharacterized protein n=1 Tax=Rhizopus azygosporus TaxID=86630 RepID=A0A367K4D2_RHIAZ|nr:hypothetical protein CU097_004678 [Rhizopus azygosporus]
MIRLHFRNGRDLDSVDYMSTSSRLLFRCLLYAPDATPRTIPIGCSIYLFLPDLYKLCGLVDGSSHSMTLPLTTNYVFASTERLIYRFDSIVAPQ